MVGGAICLIYSQIDNTDCHDRNICSANTSFCVCKHRQLDLVRSCETAREKKKGQWSIQTSSDLLDSSLVEGRRFFKPSLSKLFVPGPNREMAPAGNWTQHWIIKSFKRGDIKFHHMWGIKFHHMWIFTFFSGCFGCSFSASFLLAAGVLYFSLKMSASSSSSANRSIGFLAPTFSRWAVKTRASKQCAPPELQRSLAGLDPHLPGSFWLLPLKKSSSPSSSSNRPPPPTLPPAGTCLTAVGVPSSLLPTESESFRAPNRLLSGERRRSGWWRKAKEGKKCQRSSWSRYLAKLIQHPRESSFRLCQNLQQKREIHVFSVCIFIPQIYWIPCTRFFRRCILPALFRLSLRTFLSSATGGFGSSENRSPWKVRQKARIKVLAAGLWKLVAGRARETLNEPRRHRRRDPSPHWRGHFSRRKVRSRRCPSSAAWTCRRCRPQLWSLWTGCLPRRQSESRAVKNEKLNSKKWKKMKDGWKSYPVVLEALVLFCFYFSSWMPMLPSHDMAGKENPWTCTCNNGTHLQWKHTGVFSIN